MHDHDVYSFGVVSSSTLYTIRGDFPAPEGYGEIEGVQPMVGGEAANSSIVLARLGASVKLDGNWIGADEAGRRTRGILGGFGIDTSRLEPRDGYHGVQEAVFAAGRTRTVFGTYVRLQEERAWNQPSEEDILRSRVVCLDPFFGEASDAVSRIASEAGIPAVTVDCLPGGPVAARAAAVVVSESFLRENFPGRPAEAVFDEYLASSDGLVVFTFGDREAWHGRRGMPVHRVSAYAVEAVDTCGAGDAFRAGVAFGFLRGWDDAKTIDFSAALAAIVCTKTPGVLDSPGLDEVCDFIRLHRGS